MFMYSSGRVPGVKKTWIIYKEHIMIFTNEYLGYLCTWATEATRCVFYTVFRAHGLSNFWGESRAYLMVYWEIGSVYLVTFPLQVFWKETRFCDARELVRGCECKKDAAILVTSLQQFQLEGFAPQILVS